MLASAVTVAYQPRPHLHPPTTSGPTKNGPATNAHFLPLCFDNDTNCSPRNPLVLITIQIPLPYTSQPCRISSPQGPSPWTKSPLTPTTQILFRFVGERYIVPVLIRRMFAPQTTKAEHGSEDPPLQSQRQFHGKDKTKCDRLPGFTGAGRRRPLQQGMRRQRRARCIVPLRRRRDAWHEAAST
jgi:hypothetical protein